MATLLIETKEVRALEVHAEDLQALLRAVHKVPLVVLIYTRPDVRIDLGSFKVEPMSQDEKDLLADTLKLGSLGIAALEEAIQDLVNRDELPEGHYLLNASAKVDEFASGGTVNRSVLNLEASIAAGLACARATDFEVV
jgi:hypothetical protein